MKRNAEQPLIFRPFVVLPVLMAVAGALWTGVLVYLLTFDGIPTQTLLSAGGFALFFALAVLYYGRSAVVVDETGVAEQGSHRELVALEGRYRALRSVFVPLTFEGRRWGLYEVGYLI